jgi:hypothetical protein
MDDLHGRAQALGLYSHLETLTTSTEGRLTQLYTLSSNDGKLPDL